MSTDAITWAKRTSFGSPVKKLVMFVLCDYADESWSCYPGQQTIADVTDMGERTVRRALSDLEADGWIRRETRRRTDGSRTSDRFYIAGGNHGGLRFSQPASPAGSGDQPADAAATNRPERPGVPARAAGHEPPGEPPEGTTSREHDRGQLALVATPADAFGPMQGQALGSDRDLAFMRFWEEYPRRAGKGQARKAWVAVRRRGIPPELIVAGARRYARDPNRDPAYTKLPATWLNGECWTDEPLPERSAPSGSAPTTAAAARAVISRLRNEPPDPAVDPGWLSLPAGSAGP